MSTLFGTQLDEYVDNNLGEEISPKVYVKYDENRRIIHKREYMEDYKCTYYYYQNGNLQYYSKVKLDNKDKEWTYYYEKGQVEIEGKVKNKKGIVKSYFPQGDIRMIQYIKNNKAHGKYISYYKNGNIHERGYYKDDKKSGKWEVFGENGNKTLERRFKNDYLDGAFIEYENNKIISKKVYINGILKK